MTSGEQESRHAVDQIRGRTPLAAIVALLILGSILVAAWSTPSEAGANNDTKATATPSFAPDLPGQASPRATSAARSSSISRSRLRKSLKKLSAKAGSSSGVYVWDTGAGDGRREIYGRNEGHARKLASNQKLFTTATALNRLGADGRIKTLVFKRGAINSQGTLKGDLILRGGGDPALGSRSYAQARGYPVTPMTALASDIKKAGIKKVRGSVVADDSVFDRRRGVPDSNYQQSPYIAPLSGLTYNHSSGGGDPALNAAAALKGRLKGKGIKVKGGIKLGRASKAVRSRPPIGEIGSPTIADLAAATNKPSDNFYAEMLLKRIWAKDGRRGTTPGGAKAVERFARSVGSKVDAKDGSGLTDNNRSSPRNVVRLLSAMRRHDAARAFNASLADAGRDGTLRDRMRGSAADGRCRAKTGTITGVSTLSGYCRSGRDTIVFSILMNGVSISYAHSLQDRMVIDMARYRP